MKKYKVEGMQCASCASSLEIALKRNPNVTSVNVNIANHTLSVEAKDYLEVENIAKSLGFPLLDATINTVNLKIDGISCASCVSAIEQSVKKLPNVESINVSLPTKTAQIMYTNQKDNIISTIEALGYQVQQPVKKQSQLTWIVLTGVLLFVLAMLPMFHIPLPKVIDPHHSPITHYTIQFILSIIILYLCKDILISGFKKLMKKIPNMDSLIFIGVAASMVYSIYEYILLFSNTTHKMLYFESAGMILVFVKVGKYFEEKSKNKSFDAMKSLMMLAPKTARLMNGEEKAVDDLVIGDIVVVKPGESFPIDGIVVNGNSFVDESFLTGESMPNEKEIGDAVFAGTQNQNGYIEYKVTKKNDQSVLAQIIQLVENAQNSKAPIAKIADVISGYFVWGILLLSTIVFIIWMIISKDFNFSISIVIAILVIACPCALGLATPIAIIVGGSKASQHHILFKNATAMQTLSEIDYVIFDKTGTLTSNILKVQSFHTFSEKDVLQIVASIENASEHPLGKTIIEYAKEKTLLPVSNFNTYPGMGISGVIEENTYFVGNKKMMDHFAINYTNELSLYQEMIQTGETVLFIADEKKCIGLVGIKGETKENAATVIDYLNKHHIRSMIVSGDVRESVQSISHQLKITSFKAEVLPQDKHIIVEELKQQGFKVAMVGDGINDAIALTSASVGVAIGSGSEIAINSADVILMKSDILDFAIAIDLAKHTMRNVKQNLFWAFLYNTIGIVIASGALYSMNILLHPMFAAFAMSISSISVVGNALRLFRYRFK